MTNTGLECLYCGEEVSLESLVWTHDPERMDPDSEPAASHDSCANEDWILDDDEATRRLTEALEMEACEHECMGATDCNICGPHDDF